MRRRLKSRARTRGAAHVVPSISVFIDTAHSWGRRLVSGIIEYAQVHGPWHLALHSTDPTELAGLGTRWQPDGVIALVNTPELARMLTAKKVPVVNCSQIEIPGFRAPRVMGSIVGDARLAAEHFWSRGLRSFCYVGDPGASYTQANYEAFKSVVAAKGHPCAFHRAVARPESLVGWLQSLPKPVGLFCFGPAIGHQVLDACLLADIRVPHDVLVLGDDFDELHSEASFPAQSGIRQACEQIGRTAADVLHKLMRGGRPAKETIEIEPLGVIARLSTDAIAAPDPRVGAAMRFILEHADEPISVDDILRRHPMARRSLERKFRETFGRTIVEQMQQARVNKLRLLLAETDEPVTTLSDRCGFASYKYMGLVFRRLTGMTPREFRQQNRAARLRRKPPLR